MSKISLVYAFTISDSLPYFSAKMLFARLYPSDVKGNVSIVRFTLKSSSSRRYENFVIGATLVLSMVSLNFPQNRGQSMKVPSNLAWMSLDVLV